MMLKVYRLADRIAKRAGKEALGRAPAVDLATAVRELDAVIAWCDGLTAPPTDPLNALKGDAA